MGVCWVMVISRYTRENAAALSWKRVTTGQSPPKATRAEICTWVSMIGMSIMVCLPYGEPIDMSM